MAEKKQISLQRQQRAVHAAEAFLEKHYIVAGLYGSTDPTVLKDRETQHTEAYVAARETLDLMMEFPEDSRSFLRELEGRRASTQKQAAA